tara:strand:- start:657 stop:947 length:291 start_codon:yes stop_codon:yes gene_type:complete
MNEKWKAFKVGDQSKKNFLKENCGDSAPPMSMTPSEVPPVAGDVTQMTPEAAFDAGYNAAVSEMMEVISQMMAGGIPVDIPVPADIAHMDQLEEEG